MHLPPGRAVGIGQIFCLVILFVVSNCLSLAIAQEKSPQKPGSEATPAKPQPTPPGQQKPAPEIDGPVIINTDLITFTVTVTDTYGRFVSGLSKNAFTVFDDSTPRESASTSDGDSPVSVGVILDGCGSMSCDKVRRARGALAKCVQTSHSSDEYFLSGFNPRAQLLLDKTRDG